MDKFRYFPNFPEGAQLRPAPCQYCAGAPAIPSIRLGSGATDGGTVCGDCLAQGMGVVAIPPWLRRDLAAGVEAKHPDWSEEQQSMYIAARVDELSHTPPVPWLQNNEWLVCEDDFATYIGEVTREVLEREQGSINEAKVMLRRILEETLPAWEQTDDAIKAEWEDLGNYLAVFRFLCRDGTVKYVVQTA